MQFNMKQPSFKFSDDVAGINKDETEWAKNWKKNGWFQSLSDHS